MNSYDNDDQLKPVNDEPLTPVIFRAERRKSPGITAVFPTLAQELHLSEPGYTCYSYCGQHACTKTWYLTTRSATPTEYTPTLRELEAMGYNLQIITRWPKMAKKGKP